MTDFYLEYVWKSGIINILWLLKEAWKILKRYQSRLSNIKILKCIKYIILNIPDCKLFGYLVSWSTLLLHGKEIIKK